MSSATDTEGTISIERVAELSERVIREVAKAVVGKREVLELAMAAFLSSGAHILLEDKPGLAKTLLAASFSRALGLDFKSVQFSPDLLAEDFIGGYAFDGENSAYAIRKGPVFAQLLLADGINRATPQAQAALFEAMQEGRIALEGETLSLPEPFIVIATQNPLEQEDFFSLPEAWLDRFAIRLTVGYPQREDEEEILRRRIERRRDEVSISPALGPETLLAMRDAVEKVHADPDIRAYIVAIASRSRKDPRVAVGASPRGSLALLQLSRALAAMRGRDVVLPEDVKRLAAPALAHRMALEPEGGGSRPTEVQIIDEILRSAPVPIITAGNG
jgi:MoxR-like ATPase